MHLTMQQLQAKEEVAIICKHSQLYISIKGNQGNLPQIVRVYHQECLQQEEKVSVKVLVPSRAFTIQIYLNSKVMIHQTIFKTNTLNEHSHKDRTCKHQPIEAIQGPARNIDKTPKCKAWKQSQATQAYKRLRMHIHSFRSNNVPSRQDNLKISLSTKKTFWNNWIVMRFMIN